MGIVLSVLLGAAPSLAQQEGVAESLFRQAREDMKRGEPAAACPKLEESYRLDPSIGTLLNLGLCERALGRSATAWTKLRQFVDAAPANDSRLQLAKKKIAELERELPRVRILVAEDARQGTITLDGVELRDASLGESLPVDPGEHAARIVMPTNESNEVRFQIRAAETLDLRVSRPVAVAVAVPVQSLTKDQPRIVPHAKVRTHAANIQIAPRRTERSIAYGIGAAGATGLVISGIFGALVLSDKQIVRDHCPNHACRDQTGLDAAHAGAQNEAIADLAFVVGSLAAASAALLFWHSEKASVALSGGLNGASLSCVGVMW